jgi:hypothetical protein
MAGLILYGVVLAVSPALHHDFACHLKTPTHCDACHASPVAPQPAAPIDVVQPVITASTNVESWREAPTLEPALLRSSGRAPPA